MMSFTFVIDCGLLSGNESVQVLLVCALPLDIQVCKRGRGLTGLTPLSHCCECPKP